MTVYKDEWYVCMCVYMFFMDSETAESNWAKLGMSPTYDTRMVLGHIPMTLAHSNRPGSIATKPYSHRFQLDH